MMLRGAINLNNEDYIYTAKNKFPLFFGRNHPHYQQFISNERKIEATMPRDLLYLKYTFLVLSLT